MFRHRSSRHARWAKATKPPVGVTGGTQGLKKDGTQTDKRTRCAGCSNFIEPGTPFTRLRLRPDLARPCSVCSVAPKKSKRFHPSCTPADDAGKCKAMHYDPTKAPAPAAPPPTQGRTVAPPPLPPTVEDQQLAALNAIVACIKTRCGKNPALIAELAPDFKTFQGISARALRPGTSEEGVVAIKMALIRALKLVF